MRPWRMPATHYAPPDQVHYTWDAAHAPSLTGFRPYPIEKA